MLKNLIDGVLYDFFGWKKFQEGSLDFLLKEKRSIILYPHTTCLDYFLILFYSKVDPELTILNKKLTIAVDDFTNEKRAGGSFLNDYTSINKIKIKNPKEIGSGNIKTIISQLEKISEWSFVITPRMGDKWRTGWYYIAKHFDVPIIIAGPDFNTQKMKFFDEKIYINDRNYEEVEKEVKKYYSQIIPFFPSLDPTVELRPYNNYISIFFINNLISMFLIFLILICCFVFAIYAQNKKIKTGIPCIMNYYKKIKSYY